MTSIETEAPAVPALGRHAELFVDVDVVILLTVEVKAKQPLWISFAAAVSDPAKGEMIAAVIVPAVKLPDPSRATIALAVFAFVAVVAAFGIVPLVMLAPDMTGATENVIVGASVCAALVPLMLPGCDESAYSIFSVCPLSVSPFAFGDAPGAASATSPLFVPMDEPPQFQMVELWP